MKRISDCVCKAITALGQRVCFLVSRRPREHCDAGCQRYDPEQQRVGDPKTGGRQWEPECQRLEGIALLGLNRLEDAEHALQEALRVARTQQAKAYELRAAMSLARLWGERGRRTEAREVLAPAYGWFTEGFETADLKEAKKLLDQLT